MVVRKYNKEQTIERIGSLQRSKEMKEQEGPLILRSKLFLIDDYSWEIFKLIANYRGNSISFALRDLVMDFIEKNKSLGSWEV